MKLSNAVLLRHLFSGLWSQERKEATRMSFSKQADCWIFRHGDELHTEITGKDRDNGDDHCQLRPFNKDFGKHRSLPPGCAYFATGTFLKVGATFGV